MNNIEFFKKQNPDCEFLNNEDKTKLFFTKENISGEKLSQFLMENNIEDELFTNKGVLCLCGIGTTKKKLKKLSRILSLKKNKKTDNFSDFNYQLNIPEMALKPKDAMNSEYEIIKSKNSIGKIIAENITPYPPCVSILMMGEVIQKEHLAFLDENVKIIKKKLFFKRA